jgi:hypothetical protein
MKRVFFTVLILLLLSQMLSCSGVAPSPTAPTTTGALLPAPLPSPSPSPVPAPATWTLLGTVRDDQSNAQLSGVTALLTNGVNAARTTATDTAGAYTLANLTQGVLSVSFALSDYGTVSRSFVLIENTRLDVVLRHLSPPSPSPTPNPSPNPNPSGGGRLLKRVGRFVVMGLQSRSRRTGANGAAALVILFVIP